ncbi:hypothetical protein [Shewanella sp. 10N.286.54.B9]|uniref:hypothetical protein n=1 Tax=Shewanella sp. 10N.286.54.B9 TaxID=3229719 RepID=UPI00354FFE0B
MNEIKSDANSDSNADEKIDGFPYWLTGLLLGAFAIAICILGLYLWQFSGAWGNQELFAQFGDFVGGTINPILGFATIGLLVWSINIQLKELRDTRREARDSRKAFELQLKLAKDETRLKQMQMGIDYFVRERNTQLDRNIHLGCLQKIGFTIYSRLESNRKNEFEVDALVEGLKNTSYRLVFENSKSFEATGNIPNFIEQSEIREIVLREMLSDDKVRNIINTYLYYSLQIVKVLFDYHALTMYKTYTIMTLLKESAERLAPLKELFDEYDIGPLSPELYDELLERIEEIQDLDIY